MRTKSASLSGNAGGFADRLTLFLFFLIGSVVSLIGALTLPDSVSPRLFMSGVLLSVLVFSASVLGAYLLPVCALSAGFYAEQSAVTLLSAWHHGGAELRSFLGSMILVPLFFLCTVHGMAMSGTIQDLVSGGCPSARSLCRHEFLVLGFYAVAGFAAIFFFT